MGIIGRWHVGLFKTQPSPEMLLYLKTYVLPKETITLAGLADILSDIRAHETTLRNRLQGGNNVV